MKENSENNCMKKLRNFLCPSQKEKYSDVLNESVIKLVCEKDEEIILSMCRENVDDLIEKYIEETKEGEEIFLFYTIFQIYEVFNKLYKQKNYNARKDIIRVLEKYDLQSSSIILDIILDHLTKYEKTNSKKWRSFFNIIKNAEHGKTNNLGDISEIIKIYEQNDLVDTIKNYKKETTKSEIIKAVYNLYKNEPSSKSNKNRKDLKIISDFLNTIKIYDEKDAENIAYKISKASNYYKDDKIIKRILEEYKNQ